MSIMQKTEETIQSHHIDLLGIKEGINPPIPSHLWPLIGQRLPHEESILPSYVLCYPALWGNQIQNPQYFISVATHGGRSQNSHEYSWVGHGHQNYCGSTVMSMMEAMSKSSPPPHTTLGNQTVVAAKALHWINVQVLVWGRGDRRSEQIWEVYKLSLLQ